MPLRLDWCSFDAAKYACEHWHYSGCMPSGKTVKIGVWEDARFIGAIIFAKGAGPQMHVTYRLKNTEIAELARVALTAHKATVSRIVAIAIKLLRKQSPGLKLLISYADPEQGAEERSPRLRNAPSGQRTYQDGSRLEVQISHAARQGT